MIGGDQLGTEPTQKHRTTKPAFFCGDRIGMEWEDDGNLVGV